MTNLLNQFINISSLDVGNSGLDAPITYQPATPRLAFGIVGIALTVVTFAVSVILPAQIIPGNRDSRVLGASMISPVAQDVVALTSITVVAARDPERHAILRVSSAAQ